MLFCRFFTVIIIYTLLYILVPHFPPETRVGMFPEMFVVTKHAKLCSEKQSAEKGHCSCSAVWVKFRVCHSQKFGGAFDFRVDTKLIQFAITNAKRNNSSLPSLLLRRNSKKIGRRGLGVKS
jgi:hypothetical protein